MALSALTVLFTEDERPKAVGVYEAANFLALPLGPILGGWMLSRLWWGWVFLLNVPVVVIGLVVVAILVPESRAAERPALDVPGIAMSTVGLVALTYGLIGAGEHGWSHPIPLATMAAGLVVLARFVVWERRLAGRRGQPLVPPRLFASASFTWGAVLGGVAGLGMIGLLFVLPQYFQAIQNADTFGSGLLLLPLVAGLILGAAPASVLVKTIGAKPTVTAGFVLIAVGSLLGTETGAGSSEVFIAAWMAVLCAGTGLTLTAATAAALARLSEDASGVGSAVVQAFQKTSAPLGTAIMGSALAAAYIAHLHLPHLPAEEAAAIRHSVYDGVTIADRLHSPELAEQVRDAFVHGLSVSLFTSAGIAVLGIVVTLAFLPGHAHQDPHQNREQPSIEEGVHAGDEH